MLFDFVQYTNFAFGCAFENEFKVTFGTVGFFIVSVPSIILNANALVAMNMYNIKKNIFFIKR